MVAATQENATGRRSLALTISLVFHGLVLLFFLFYKIITPIPPFPQSEGGGAGLELALGYTELGMGDNTQDPEPSIPAATATAQPQSQPEPEVLTNEAETEAPAVVPKTPEKPKTTKPKTEKPKQPTKEQQEQAFKNKLNNLWNTTGGSGSSGKGASDVPGVAGGSEGTAGGTGIGNGTGSYRGDGWSIDLAGRTIRRKPSIQEKPHVGGKVVLDIWVSADGKVERVSQNTDKSTTLDQTLVGLAKRAALESSFYPDPKARDDQRGTMTFIFVLQ
jgi:outer membrane biosynthesis protein TonB